MRIILSLYLVTWTSTKVIDDLPHCSRSTVMEGEIREHDAMGRPKIYSAVQLSMALHELACMTIKQSLLQQVLQMPQSHASKTKKFDE
ncbi:hypothetical protein KIN20_006425 [Parelaphostrongylus tenuis]|uniref:Secreted protein n=1 Tax=Parelaphostrongylus tenuis TaxID=148309 RepID=A0AAD5MMZ2_PARTN|nr:hypothetical protein KIN20_006425 [Parelaphostrongylus tenuis]